MELPENAWSDDDGNESGTTKNTKRGVNGIKWYWWCIAVALLLVLGLGALALL